MGSSETTSGLQRELERGVLLLVLDRPERRNAIDATLRDALARSAILAESLAQTALLQSEDHQERLAAARERRPPTFVGR